MDTSTGRTTRLGRAERRDRILDAATRAFAGAAGYAGVGLGEVAREAGVTRVIVYRHFDSKAELYRAAIDRATARLHDAATGQAGELGTDSVPALVAWAYRDPDAFRLLFRDAPREPEFGAEAAGVRDAMATALRARLPEAATRRLGAAWTDWAARLATATTIDGILAWLEVGAPDPDLAAERILTAVDGVYRVLDSSDVTSNRA